MLDLKFEITNHSKTQDLDFLTQKINKEIPSYGAAYPFAIFAKDVKNSIVAGCNGSIIFGAIYTDQLWVAPLYRKKGIGKHLMELVHEYGRKQGCTIATVATMDFQAPEFYQMLGYQKDFERKGYARGSKLIFLSKDLH